MSASGKKASGTAAPAAIRRSLLSVALPAGGAAPRKLKKKAFGELRKALQKAVRAADDEGLEVQLDLAVLAAAAGRTAAADGAPEVSGAARGSEAPPARRASSGSGSTAKTAGAGRARVAPTARKVATASAPGAELPLRAAVRSRKPAAPAPAASAPDGDAGDETATPVRTARRTLRRTPARPPVSP